MPASTITTTVKLSQGEYDKLALLAQGRGLSLSAMLRVLVNEADAREGEGDPNYRSMADEIETILRARGYIK